MRRCPLRASLGVIALVVGSGGWGGCLEDRAPESRPKEVVLPDLSPTGAGKPGRPRARRRPPHRPRSTGPVRGFVTAAWVERHLSEPGVVLLDLRTAARYRAGHAPGAHNDPGGEALWRVLGPRRGNKGARRKPPALRAMGRGRTVVLIHGGRTMRELSVATRAYLLLYDAGAAPARLAVLQGGHAIWHRERRPLETGPRRRSPAAAPPRPAPAGRPGPGLTPRRIILADGARLAATRKQPRTTLYDARPQPSPRAHPRGSRRPAPAMGRLPWQQFDVAAHLLPPLGLTAPWNPTLRRPLATLQADTANQHLVLFSAQGRWASLLWFALKTRLVRADSTLSVYFGLPPKR